MLQAQGTSEARAWGFDTPEAHGHASPYRPSGPKLGFSAEPGSGRLGDNRCECNAAFPSGTVTAPAYVRVRVCRTPGIFLLHISRRFELDLSPMALTGGLCSWSRLTTGQLGGTGLVSALVVVCQRVTGRCSEDHSGPPLGIRPLG